MNRSAKEATSIRRRLANADPRHQLSLARSLDTMGAILAALGRDEEAAKAQQKAREAEALLIEANYSYADFLDQAGKRAESAPFLKSGDDCRTAELEALKTPSQKANQ